MHLTEPTIDFLLALNVQTEIIVEKVWPVH